MTIAAAYLVSDGVVLGADSATTVALPTPHGQNVRQILTHAQKVFEILPNSTMAAVTWGQGGYDSASHRTVLFRLGASLPATATVEQAANQLASIIPGLNPGSQVGYFIGGIDPATRDPACFMVEFTPGVPVRCNPIAVGDVGFAGCPQFFQRIFYGFDFRVQQIVTEELLSSRQGDASVADDCKRAFEKAQLSLQLSPFRDLCIREAVDYVYSIIYSTIKGFKFSGLPPICGGPVEVGVVTTDKPFRWVCHKGFESAIDESISPETWR